MQIQLRDDGGGTERIVVEPIGPDLYRLEETPLLASSDDDPIYAGDIIELEAVADGSHRLVRVVVRSPMQHYEWLLPREFVESADLIGFLDEVEEQGGRWERISGGLLYVHLPPESSFNVDAELTRRITAARLHGA